VIEERISALSVPCMHMNVLSVWQASGAMLFL
jgi:hypothetical protein